MVHGLTLLLVSLLYVGLLLAVAWKGDRAGPARGPQIGRASWRVRV